MAKVKIQGNASGTGVLTVTAPNTSTDRTLTLPDSTATLFTDAGGTMTGALNVSESGNNAEIKVGTQTAHAHQGYSGVQFEDRGYIGGYPNDSLGIFYNTYHSSGSKAIETGTAANVQLLNGGIRFQTAPSVSADAAQTFTDAVMINTAGVVSIPNGVELGSGIDATAANTLDDYEEGTFTMAMYSGQSGTITNTTANYTKIGRNVTVNFYGSINDAEGNSFVRVSGFPFSLPNIGIQCTANYSHQQSVELWISSGGYFYYQNTTVGGNNQGQDAAWLDDETWISFNVTYII